MITRRKALYLFGAVSTGAWLASGQTTTTASPASKNSSATEDGSPALAPGAPMSPQRIALIDAFKEKSEGLEKKFESRSYKSDWTMPYRLFRPAASGKLPLVMYLHGSGALGDDNQMQMGLGNIFGTRVWALPENQKNFPCYVVAPQTDRGWCRYAVPTESDKVYRAIPGLGEGARLAFFILDALCHEFPIDERRIYITGQSMGGGGAWNMLASRPAFFAGAAICCGSATTETGTESLDAPVWNFHGDADKTVPVTLSRDRIAARKKAGGHPLYTEYAGVDHNVWEWAYTEPELPRWLFAQRRGN